MALSLIFSALVYLTAAKVATPEVADSGLVVAERVPFPLVFVSLARTAARVMLAELPVAVLPY